MSKRQNVAVAIAVAILVCVGLLVAVVIRHSDKKKKHAKNQTLNTRKKKLNILQKSSSSSPFNGTGACPLTLWKSEKSDGMSLWKSDGIPSWKSDGIPYDCLSLEDLDFSKGKVAKIVNREDLLDDNQLETDWGRKLIAFQWDEDDRNDERAMPQGLTGTRDGKYLISAWYIKNSDGKTIGSKIAIVDISSVNQDPDSDTSGGDDIRYVFVTLSDYQQHCGGASLVEYTWKDGEERRILYVTCDDKLDVSDSGRGEQNGYINVGFDLNKIIKFDGEYTLLPEIPWTWGSQSAGCFYKNSTLSLVGLEYEGFHQNDGGAWVESDDAEEKKNVRAVFAIGSYASSKSGTRSLGLFRVLLPDSDDWVPFDLFHGGEKSVSRKQISSKTGKPKAGTRECKFEDAPYHIQGVAWKRGKPLYVMQTGYKTLLCKYENVNGELDYCLETGNSCATLDEVVCADQTEEKACMTSFECKDATPTNCVEQNGEVYTSSGDLTCCCDPALAFGVGQGQDVNGNVIDGKVYCVDEALVCDDVACSSPKYRKPSLATELETCRKEMLLKETQCQKCSWLPSMVTHGGLATFDYKCGFPLSDQPFVMPSTCLQLGDIIEYAKFAPYSNPYIKTSLSGGEDLFWYEGKGFDRLWTQNEYAETEEEDVKRCVWSIVI